MKRHHEGQQRMSEVRGNTTPPRSYCRKQEERHYQCLVQTFETKKNTTTAEGLATINDDYMETASIP
jgi:hypothetical protein